jgi:polyhydroxyalkanoate synthase subunit PhaC
MDTAQTEHAAGGGDISAALDPMQLRVALTDLMNPKSLAAEMPRLTTELAKVVLGMSDVEFGEKDARFADPAWRDNPLYRLIGQSYLAWEQSVGRIVQRHRGDWQRQERARYVANILTGGLAPTNFLPTNPAALKRAFETGGMSLLRGYRNFLRDLLTNRGMPQMVDTRPFTVGKNLAITSGSVVYREEMFELLQYKPATETVRERPLLFVPPEINKYYVLDLAPGRSMVEYAISRGIHAFMLVWRNPRLDKSAGHGHWGMDDYLAAHVRAFDVVREITGAGDLNLVGLCAGGMTSALVQAHLAAGGGNPVQAATYIVTMLDARQPNMVTTLATPQADTVLAREARKGTVIDATTVRHNFAWMRPGDLVYSYVVNDWLLGNDAPAFDVLAWNDDATNMSGTFALESNALLARGMIVQPGGVSYLGTPIDLSKVTSAAFFVAGQRDHITTWRPCYMTSRLLGGDTEVVIVNSGHIQTFVNPVAKSRYKYWWGPVGGPDPDAWLAHAEVHDGSWWPRWAEWLLPRSGAEKPAPDRLGSDRYPPLEPAPGRYVHEK